MRSEMEPVVETTSPGATFEVAGVRPYPLPDNVIPIRREVDWDAFMPARAGTLRWRIACHVKRAFDIVASGLGLLVLLPFLALVALLVRMTSPGPVLYRSRYIGLRERPFVAYKLRTMIVGAEEMKPSMAHLNHMRGPAFKIRNDPRVTPLGRFLRKYSIDELPQIWSVLKGDMSLVGPRPARVEDFAGYQPWHRARLAVKPGITCWWQINGRSDIHDFDEWMRLDLKYISEWSLWVDLRILARTLPAVLRGHGAY